MPERTPAVAGRFYPAGAEEALAAIESLASQAGRLADRIGPWDPPAKSPRIVMLPHAGWIFSGLATMAALATLTSCSDSDQYLYNDEETVARPVAEVRPVERDPDRPAGTAGSLPQEPEALRAAAGGEHRRIGRYVAVTLQVAFRDDGNPQHARIGPGQVAEEPDEQGEHEGGGEKKPLPAPQRQPEFPFHGSRTPTAGCRRCPW